MFSKCEQQDILKYECKKIGKKSNEWMQMWYSLLVGYGK